MTPKEKAQQLVDRFYNLQSSIAWTTNDELKRQASIFNDELGEDVEIYWDKLAKQTAVISVDEILKSFGTLTNGNVFYTTFNAIEYYQEVKQEIINLLNQNK
jgi:hypothetical protein